MQKQIWYRSGLTLGELVAVVVAVVIATFIFFSIAPTSCVRNGQLSHRTACAANMSGIGKGLHTYAMENRGFFPIASHVPATQPGIGVVRYAPGITGKYRVLRPPASAPTDHTSREVSTTTNLWTLIRAGGSTPGSFICPDSDDQKNDEDNPWDFWDFAKYSEVSYGYQVPYGLKGIPSSEGDQRMVLAADKGPFGAALEAGKRHPGLPKLGLDASPDEWRFWNSPNHGGQGDGEGQNVLYADSHAEWANKPIAGVKYDNIYTRWGDPTGGTDADPTPRINGTPPTGIETPFGDTDSLIYP